MSKIVNIKDYGSIEEAAKALGDDGGTIYFPPGFYDLDYTPPENIKLHGAGTEETLLKD